MIRTVISLDPESKAWLDRQAKKEKLSMAELIRTAVRKYREEQRPGAASFDDLLNETRGIWRCGDALEYQRRLRREWKQGQ